MKSQKKKLVYLNVSRVFIAVLCLETAFLIVMSLNIDADDKSRNKSLEPEQRLLGTAPTSNGFVAYYKFDEGSGTTTADSSGNSFNGQIQGNWINTDLPDVGFANPNALSFNGSSDFVRVPPAAINDLSAAQSRRGSI